MTFQEMATEYLNSPKFLSLEAQTQAMYANHTRKLLKLGGSLPIVDGPMQNPVAQKRSPKSAAVAQGNLPSEWFKRIDTGCETNVSKLACRTQLSIIYKWAVMQGKLVPNQDPVPYIDKRLWKHEPASKRPYLKEEIDLIEAVANSGKMPEELVPYAYFCVVLFDLGCRPEEMYEHQHTWFSKRDNEKYFDIHNAKGKARGELSRYVVMGARTQRLINWFRTQPIALGNEAYTFRTNNGYRFHQATTSKKVKEVCTLIGIPERALYNARRGCAKAMLDAGQSIYDAANRLGNSPAVVRKHYAGQDLIEKARSGIPAWQK